MEEYHSRFPMEKTVMILRRSVYTFLQKYQSFSTIAALLAFPFAILLLLSESLVPTSSLQGIHNRFRFLFVAAGFPSSSNFFIILNAKLSQTIATSYLVLPFTFTFFLFSKGFVIHTLSNKKAVKYSPLFHTQLCNTLIIISANATCFCLLFFAFSCVDGLGLVTPKTLLFFSATGAVLYSIVLANALIICNLALILSGMENCSGFMAVLKACVLIRGRTATALSLAVPINMALAGIEALFQYRIVRSYHHLETHPFSSMVFEGMFIAYLYAILLVLDTIVGCAFYRSCQTARHIDLAGEQVYQTEFEGKDSNVFKKWKTLEDLP